MDGEGGRDEWMKEGRNGCLEGRREGGRAGKRIRAEAEFTWTTYPDTHLKFFGRLFPFTSTVPAIPLLPLRSAIISNSLYQTMNSSHELI